MKGQIVSGTSPYIRPDATHTTTSRGTHHPGTGVDEPGYLILNTKDVTRIDKLITDELMEWWAGVYRFRLTGTAIFSDRPLAPVDVRSVIQSLFENHVLPVAMAVATEAQQHARLSDATFESGWRDVPDIDVVIDPLAIAILIAQLTDGPLDSREALEEAIWARS